MEPAQDLLQPLGSKLNQGDIAQPTDKNDSQSIQSKTLDNQLNVDTLRAQPAAAPAGNQPPLQTGGVSNQLAQPQVSTVNSNANNILPNNKQDYPVVRDNSGVIIAIIIGAIIIAASILLVFGLKNVKKINQSKTAIVSDRQEQTKTYCKNKVSNSAMGFVKGPFCINVPVAWKIPTDKRNDPNSSTWYFVQGSIGISGPFKCKGDIKGCIEDDITNLRKPENVSVKVLKQGYPTGVYYSKTQWTLLQIHYSGDKTPLEAQILYVPGAVDDNGKYLYIRIYGLVDPVYTDDLKQILLSVHPQKDYK